MPPLASSRTKNDATTTAKPVSGPTERSMPPVSITMSCPIETKASAVSRVSMLPKLAPVR